jgi:hypothetical protein
MVSLSLDSHRYTVPHVSSRLQRQGNVEQAIYEEIYKILIEAGIRSTHFDSLLGTIQV